MVFIIYYLFVPSFIHTHENNTEMNNAPSSYIFIGYPTKGKKYKTKEALQKGQPKNQC